MNSNEDLKGIIVTEQFLSLPGPDQEEEFQMLTAATIDEDFMIVSDEVWAYLHEIYGGNDIPRKSIEILQDGNTQKKEFMIEIFH